MWHDSEMPDAEKVHRFSVRASWRGDAMGSGSVSKNNFPSLPIAGAVVLGGAGTGANPEELLLAALGACFVNTWAIFVKKLNLNHEALALDVSGELGQDPAGGYRMERALIRASVPAALLAENRAGVEKSLALAEKYCIISKVVRASMELRVEIQEA
jgi:osmotically inducible protein OsmC